MCDLREEYDGGIYWLLDSRFDFLLPSFLREFGFEKQDVVLVNSYHPKTRDGWNKIYIPSEKTGSVVQMEPDDMNRIFSGNLRRDGKKMVIAFSGAGLPQIRDGVSLTSVADVAERCNDKWWQYHCFQKSQILTPHTYRYCDFKKLEEGFCPLLERHQKLVVKKSGLSGGYQMAVLSSKNDLEVYRKRIQNGNFVQDFLVSAYIAHRQSFSSMGVVRRDGEVLFIDIITEQVLYRQVAYEGLIYPAFLEKFREEEIRRMTEKIGEALAEEGYFGYYNVDFILGTDGLMYAAEVNARPGFGTILAACLYGERFWKMMRGISTEGPGEMGNRLVLGKIKGREGRRYSGLKSESDITEWFREKKGSFQTFLCGTEESEVFEYGSYVGIFGDFFEEEDTRERILQKFWEKCLEYYDERL